jgi:hypothetical protein
MADGLTVGVGLGTGVSDGSITAGTSVTVGRLAVDVAARIVLVGRIVSAGGLHAANANASRLTMVTIPIRVFIASSFALFMHWSHRIGVHSWVCAPHAGERVLTCPLPAQTLERGVKRLAPGA